MDLSFNCNRLSKLKPLDFAKDCLRDPPVEGIVFVIGAAAANVFISFLTVPLLGIGISMITTKLVLKALDRYNNAAFIDLTKEVCKFHKKFSKLQVIGCIVALALGYLSQAVALTVGIAVGFCGAVILDVEKHKVAQCAARRDCQ